MIGENIKKIRLSKGFGLNELARMSGVNASYISALERDEKNNPSISILEKIAAALDVSVDAFMTKSINIYQDSNNPFNGPGPIVKESKASYLDELSQSDFVQIPIVGSVRAGEPIIAQDNIEGYQPTLKAFLSRDKDYFYLKVQGDSMNIEFNEGSLLLIEKTTCVENGEIVVVLINGFEATVKKIIRNENMITLIPMSTNTDYVPKMYDITKDKIQIVGKVKQAIKIY